MILTLETPDEVLQRLAKSINTVRLANGMYTQKQQAAAAGLAPSTYIKMEQSGQGSLRDFLKVMMSLGRLHELDNLLNVEEDDLFAPKKKKDEKKRIRNKRKGNA